MTTHGVRRVPVVDEHERLVGILTLDDVLKEFASAAEAIAEVISRGQNHEHRLRR